MNAKHFRQAVYPVLLLLLGTQGCLEQKVKTTVAADGSCERTMSVTADSGQAPKTRLPLPTDAGWAVRWERPDTAKDKKFVWTASKRYPSLTALSEDTALFVQPGKIRITLEAERSFRWFYTYILYRETYHRFASLDRIPPAAVLTQDEIRRVTAGSGGDTLKSKVEEWRNLNIADYFLSTLDTLIQREALPSVTPGTVQSHRKDLMRALTEKKEITETLASYLPSVKEKDLFKDSTSALTDIGLEALRRLFVKALGTESVRQLPLAESWKKTMEFVYGAVENDAEGNFENTVTLPGLFLDTNAGTLNGNTATWQFGRDQLELMDYEMYAESRIVNTWAFIVSGVLAVGAVLVLLIPLFRAKAGR